MPTGAFFMLYVKFKQKQLIKCYCIFYELMLEGILYVSRVCYVNIFNTFCLPNKKSSSIVEMKHGDLSQYLQPVSFLHRYLKHWERDK